MNSAYGWKKHIGLKWNRFYSFHLDLRCFETCNKQRGLDPQLLDFHTVLSRAGTSKASIYDSVSRGNLRGSAESDREHTCCFFKLSTLEEHIDEACVCFESKCSVDVEEWAWSALGHSLYSGAWWRRETCNNAGIIMFIDKNGQSWNITRFDFSFDVNIDYGY